MILLSVMPLEKSLAFILEYSAHNTLPLTNTLFRFALTPKEYASGFEASMTKIFATAGGVSDWLVFFSVIQQAIGAILLFLLLLGLRNRFRLK